MTGKQRCKLNEAALNVAETANDYCRFIRLFMNQQTERPGGISVSPYEFQDGFRALNHLTTALQRIMNVLSSEVSEEMD